MHRFLSFHHLAIATSLGVALGTAASPSPLWAAQEPSHPTLGAALSDVQTSQAAAGAPASIAAQAQPSPEEVGDSLMLHQRYQAAIAAYKKPAPNAELWNKMGIAYQQMFNLEEAARCYQASLRMSSHNPRVMNNLGTIYDSMHQFNNAERMYRKALKIDPHSALINKNLGTNLLAQHHYKKGWEYYKTALQLDPHIFQNNSSPRVQNPASVEQRGAMNYYMAKGCVRAGMSECAISYLRLALNEGFTNPKKIEADSEFAVLRGQPAFEQLMAAQKE